MVDVSHKGRQFPPISYTIDANKVNEFLLAIGEQNPAYREPGAPLPPTFPTVATFWAGGGLEEALKAIEVDIWTVLHAEQEYDYTAPIHVGDTLTATTRIADIYERSGSSGDMTFVSFETTFDNQHGDTVITGTSLIIVRGG
jgi:hypothetical protein